MCKWINTTLLLVVWIISFASVAEARVYSPRVVSEHNADSYSLETFAQYPDWRNQFGDQKALALFDYLTDYNTGLYPMGAGAFEGNEKLYEYSLVRDPVKLINVFSVGYCDVLGPVMAGIWQDAGMGSARVVDVPWNDHVAAEVFYDNDWHYLDLDLRATFRRLDGSLASMEESQTNDSLWNRPNSDVFFPLDYIPDIKEAYVESDLLYRYGVHQSGHTMDFTLKQGETFTRWWAPQGGRWLHHSSYNTEPFVDQLIKQSPRGPKSKHESFSKYTHGNGQFIYQPDLTEQSTDFIDGAYDSLNIEATAAGLMLKEPGSGYAIFEVRTPYVIVPLVGSTATTADDKEASVVVTDSTGVFFSFSLDNGITWQSLPQASRLDLTKQVAGRYGYLFKMELNGTPNTAVVRSLDITTWVQLAPASLPSLRTGSNVMSFRTGDHYGLQTRVMEMRPDTTDRSDLDKYMVVEPTEYDPVSDTSRMRGPFTVVAEAPPGTRIAWFSAGASYQSNQLDEALFNDFTMSYAANLPFAYTDFYASNMPSDMEHWHTNAQQEVRLGNPADSIYLSYGGDQAINTLQVYAHLVDSAPRSPSPVEVTHVWSEGGVERTYTTTTNNNDSYYVDVDGVPTDISIKLSVPSQFPAGEQSTPLNDSSNPSGGGVFPISILCLLSMLVVRRRVRLEKTVKH